MSERDNKCTQSWADASECHAYNNGICMNGIKCGGIPNYPPQPAPDLPALLKRCKQWLKAYKGFLCDDDRENRFHTEELDALLSDIAKAEEGR